MAAEASEKVVLPPPAETIATPVCPKYRPAEARGTIASRHLSELSGLAEGARNPRAFWVHNDSGDEARVYAISEQGSWLATFRLPVATTKDAEDLALVRTRHGPRLYLADIGDNATIRRDGVFVYRFDEPKLTPEDWARASAPGTRPNETAEPKQKRTGPIGQSRLHYPDRPHDAEALLVDPWTEELVIVTKSWMGWAQIFVAREFLPDVVLSPQGEMRPEFTGEAIHIVTGGDVSVSGKQVALRTYGGAFLFQRQKGQSLAAALLGRACPIPVAREPQGEALALLDRGDRPPAVATVSEGNPTTLYVSEPE